MRKSFRALALFASLFVCVYGFAQASTQSLLANLNFRCIGPATMSGRIADIDVDPKHPATVYIATASGGVYKTTGNGVEWTSCFDGQPAASIGCVQVSRADSNVVWVGSGESNNRNSSAWGNGVYVSNDAGKTWKNAGLDATQQIARIVTDPKDPKKAWVAAIGALWNASEDRGVYMTTDGGATWQKTLYIDENTGATDIAIDPKNDKTLYVAMYERRRFPWTFRSGGKTGGIFKSTDGGKTWKKLSEGLPKGDTGKMGLAIYPKNPKIVYAMVEASRQEDGLYRSDDAGKTWKKFGHFNSRPFYYYELVVDPNDDKHLICTNTNLMESKDGGATWRSMRIGLHVDYHAVWIDPSNSQHIWVGNDGGAGVSWDGGDTWRHMSNLVAAQFYAVCYDMAYPYNVYGGLQDNGSWGGPSQSRNPSGIANYEWFRIGGGDGFHAQADWIDNETVYSESQGGAISRFNRKTGENAFIQPRSPQGERYRFNWSTPIILSPHNPRIVWFGGNKLFKSLDRGDHWRVASPDLTTNDSKKMAAMEGLTPEDTGAETHCTIITISESPIKAGVVWVGTDDGNVQVSENDGYNWTNVIGNVQGVQQTTWVSRVTASSHKLERCYATFDGHRSGDMKPYVYVTEDMGKTWTNITSNLPMGSVYVIKEDAVNENLLYIGTEFGLFVSLDRGKTWTLWSSNLPTVAVHDLVVQPREHEIILATHGRGMWIAPVEALQNATDDTLAKDVELFDPIQAVEWVSDRSGGYGDGMGWYFGDNPPRGARLSYYLKSDA
ncbi:MAG TPA: exo-alpha-sialidase, partial [Fimbriimonadales bacterium]|nr:exo-alpha-sialidase [Fimbriimonadales bacterium]